MRESITDVGEWLQKPHEWVLNLDWKWFAMMAAITLLFTPFRFAGSWSDTTVTALFYGFTLGMAFVLAAWQFVDQQREVHG